MSRKRTTPSCGRPELRATIDVLERGEGYTLVVRRQGCTLISPAVLTLSDFAAQAPTEHVDGLHVAVPRPRPKASKRRHS